MAFFRPNLKDKKSGGKSAPASAIFATTLSLSFYIQIVSTTPALATEFDDANALVVKGNYSGALSIYNRYLGWHPSSARAFYCRGKVYLSLKQSDLALADFDRAISLDAKYMDALLSRGRLLSEEKSYSRALQDYDKVIQLEPELGLYYRERGLVQYRLGEYDKAIADFDVAISRRRFDDVAYFRRALAHSALKKYHSSITDLNEAIKIKPKEAGYYLDRALSCFYIEDHYRAINDCSKAIEINPKYARALAYRAKFYALVKRNQQSADDISKALALAPDDTLVQETCNEAKLLRKVDVPREKLVEINNEGVHALNSKDFQTAVERFTEAIKLDPTFSHAKENLATAYNNWGLSLVNEPNKANIYFHKALSFNPNSEATKQNITHIFPGLGKDPNNCADRMVIADSLRKKSDFTGAVFEYREALKLKNNADAHEKLGDVLRVQEENEQAIGEYQAAILLKDSATLEVKLGQAFQTQGHLSSAIAAYTNAIQLKPSDQDVKDALHSGWEAVIKVSPKDPTNYIGLGQALELCGRNDEAEIQYQMAISLSPNGNNKMAQTLLEGLKQANGPKSFIRLVNEGVDAQEKGDFSKAASFYQNALEVNPSSANVWGNLGTAYQAMGNRDEAVSSYNKSLSFDPENSIAKQGLRSLGIEPK